MSRPLHERDEGQAAAVDVLQERPNIYHSFLTGIEEHFDATPYRQWMQRNWTCSFIIAAVYVATIFGLKRHMTDRRPYDLRVALGLWSTLLTAFSIAGTLRTVPELLQVLTQYDVAFSACNPAFYTGPTGFWVMLYTFSKVYELGDTLFIVLRKQKLIFLHWYHHLATLVYMFFSYKDFIALGRWGITLNYTVHAFMYSYYALRAFRVRVPRAVNVAITSLQLCQMVVGVTLNAWTYYIITHGAPCQQTLANNTWSFIMYASYLALFANFFYATYVRKIKVT